MIYFRELRGNNRYLRKNICYFRGNIHYLGGKFCYLRRHIRYPREKYLILEKIFVTSNIRFVTPKMPYVADLRGNIRHLSKIFATSEEIFVKLRGNSHYLRKYLLPQI